MKMVYHYIAHLAKSKVHKTANNKRCYMVSFDNFQWINQGSVRFEDDKIIMIAPALTDFFCGGERIYEHLTIEHKTVKNIRAGE